mmetsp:Transcript_44139/g.122330  ORF Transcript_44139/g.122330 Transcript_44139/m.122330 type:complete len:84 (-) Transcript_44139:1185-1436(-)
MSARQPEICGAVLSTAAIPVPTGWRISSPHRRAALCAAPLIIQLHLEVPSLRQPLQNHSTHPSHRASPSGVLRIYSFDARSAT